MNKRKRRIYQSEETRGFSTNQLNSLKVSISQLTPLPTDLPFPVTHGGSRFYTPPLPLGSCYCKMGPEIGKKNSRIPIQKQIGAAILVTKRGGGYDDQD